MKTQISRDSFQPSQHYSGVYLQQGRMILDADWNELTDLQKDRLVAALREAIASGAPAQGGLKLDTVGGNVCIRPGTLYANGLPARLDATGTPAITDQPDYPIKADYSGKDLCFYADVWERTVTALERADLMDAALHGADTATRTQTMLQVKWCAKDVDPQKNIDPLKEEQNPTLGNAPLTLKLHQIVSGEDKCDPCASQVKVEERLGNYLFRVEVHDYVDTTHLLTLKWSRDNGAETCRVEAIPTGFDQGAWVWEYYDNDTERLLGNHFATNPKKLRGLIQETCATPTGADDPKQYVRQWDGYLRIKLNTGAIEKGLDRDVALVTGPESSQTPGRVNLTAGVLKINLELMELTLATKGKQLVPGDYWLAEVREAEDKSGQDVLTAALPRGVRHRYVVLGATDSSGKLVTQDDAFARRMAFPPLTNLTADKVGFDNNCTQLYGGAVNVQEALDNLCDEIDASDIAYGIPDCDANEGKSIKDRLKAALDPNGDNKLTVKDALDKLLCQLNATTLPYTVPGCPSSPSVRELLGLTAGDNNVAPVLDKLLCEFKAKHLPLDQSDDKLCTDLQAAEVKTVQDALRVLCNKAGGGCAVVATSAGHLHVLLEEFAKSDATDLWVCLKPGTYPLGELPEIKNKRSLRINGAGLKSVSVTSGAGLRIAADEVIFEGFSFTFSTGTGQLSIRAAEARAHGCQFARTTSAADGPAMIRISAPPDAVCRLDWKGNVLFAQVETLINNGGYDWAGPNVVGDVKVSEGLLGLGKDDLLNDRAAYEAALKNVARLIMEMPQETRALWKSNLPQRPISRATIRARSPGTAKLSDLLDLDAAAITLDEAVMAVEDLAGLYILRTPDYALRLETAQVGGTLADNIIEGWLLLGNGVAGYHSPEVALAGTNLGDTGAVESGGEDLHLEHNRITAIKANLEPDSLDQEHYLVQQVTGYARLFLIGNSLASPRHTLVAASFVGQGNTWYCPPPLPTHPTHLFAPELGSLIAHRATFTGNLLEGYGDNAHLLCTASPSLRSSVGNVLIDLWPQENG